MDTSGKGMGSLSSEIHNIFLAHECLKITDFKFMVVLDFLKRAFMVSLGFVELDKGTWFCRCREVNK